MWRLRCEDCTLPRRGDDCPLAGTAVMPCGFGVDEIMRRKSLPLKWDRETRTRRKYTGIRKPEENNS